MGTGNPDVSSYIDRYGRLQSMQTDNNTRHTNFHYQPTLESPSTAQLTRIDDPYTGQTIHHRYDEENRPCGYSSTGNNALNLNVTQTDRGRTQYVLGANERFETEVEYEEAGGTNPRIRATRLFLGANNTTWFTDNEARDFTTEYRYDALGRLEDKTLTEFNAGSLRTAYAYVMSMTQRVYRA